MNPEQYLDALLSLPGMVISQSRMVSPKVSPDKKWVAWSWYRTGPAADVYAAPRRRLLRAHPPDRNARKYLHHRMDAGFPRRDRLAG